MAHMLRIQNGKASLFYVGEPPWHGLGTRLDKPATAAEAIAAADLNWAVSKKPLSAGDDQHHQLVPDRYAVVREDRWGRENCPIFGIVGQEYTPLQNSQAFEFFDPIVGENAAIYHTAGALGNGERVWVLAKLPGEIRVVGDDITEKYLLLSNSHDGLSSVQIKFTPIRVVCQNTLTQALRNGGPALSIEHRKDLHGRLKQAHRLLGIISKRFGELEESFRAMAHVSISADHLSEYLGLVFPDPRDPENEKALARARASRDWSSYFFENGKGNQAPEVRGSLWAAYNGVAEFIDHRSTSSPDDRRLEGVWFGPGYRAKARAFSSAHDLLFSWSN